MLAYSGKFENILCMQFYSLSSKINAMYYIALIIALAMFDTLHVLVRQDHLESTRKQRSTRFDWLKRIQCLLLLV